MSTVENKSESKQTVAKSLGQIWGLLALALLFGMGSYRLLSKALALTHFGVEPGGKTLGIPITAFDYALYGIILLLGFFKAYMIFYKKMVPRTLARCRTALGETGNPMDYWLAPFCMLSLYRPWKVKHAVLSWLILPLMILLAITFILWVADSPFKAAVDYAVGGALGFTALLYLYYLIRFVTWLAAGAPSASHPFPATAD